MTALLTTVLMAATGWGVAPEPPPVPQPDFAERVDYVAWYDDAVSYAAGGNALTHYGVFLYENPQRRLGNLAPQPGAFAERDLKKALEVPMHWTSDEHLGLAKWAHYLERRFAHVVMQANQYEYYATRRRPKQSMLCEISPPTLANARLISQMLIVRAWRVQQGTVDATLLPDALKACMILARHIGQGFTLDEQLFANGQRAFVYDQIRRSMRSRFHMTDAWERVLHTLEVYDGEPITHDLARALHFSEASALQLLQHLCTMLDADGNLQVMPHINPEVLNDYLALKFPEGRFQPAGADTLVDADPRVLARALHDYFTGMRALLHQSHVSDLRDKAAALERDAFGAHPELNVLTTPVGLSVRAAFRTEAQRRLAYLFLKMAVDFKLDGRWPQSLDELNGSRITESRIDPFSGDEMRLRRVRITTIPYSVGPDGADNGGDDAKDVIFWGPVAPESQYHLPPVESEQDDAAPEAAGSESGAAPDAS